jgi:DNA gyrase subunit A
METVNIAPLDDEIQSSYIDYAMSVIIGRAIPDARDGLKPVQRRILYAMHLIKNTHDQPTKKSARIVGEVIGKFHPHGDIAIYDALVRMAQTFSMNKIFVEGQGNFGSVDGDPPAAMRYTEVRLSKIAEELVADIDKETVDFVPNFDNTEIEPLVLPAKIPSLLINGASGIAVGVATSIPPHNLGEVCDALVFCLEHEDATFEQVSEIIKGPDFPTGGIALLSNNSYNGYRHGRGQIRVRARTEIDEKKHRITVTELPYNVNKSTLIQTIATLARDKRVVGISDIRDESDRSGISIVIEVKRDASPESVLNSLLRHTQLEITFPLINLAVVKNSLKTFNLLQMLSVFLEYRREVIRRRCTYELNTAKERLHIVEGLILTITKIEEIVRLIKESREVKDARLRLSDAYGLSEKQASAILDMRLSRLTHLELDEMAAEKTSLENKIEYNSSVLGDPKKIDLVIKDELKELRKYASARKTTIEMSAGEEDIDEEATISDQKITVLFTNEGYVKRLNFESYKEQDRGGRGVTIMAVNEKDYLKKMITCNMKDYLICISDLGRAYWLKGYKIPEGGRYTGGKAIVNLLNLENEKIINILNIRDFDKSGFLFLTKKGILKKISADLFSRPRANGIRAIIINPGDSVIDVFKYESERFIMITTRNGSLIKFHGKDLRFTGRNAAGVRGIRLRAGDSAVNVLATNETGYVLTATEAGFGKLTEVSQYRTQKRGGFGVINMNTRKAGIVAKAVLVNSLPDTDVMLVNSKGVAITFPVASVRITGRAAKGVHLMKLDAGVRIVDLQLLGGS